MGKELLLIEQYFFPDGWTGAQYPINIAERMVSEGWKVKVICGNIPYVNNNFFENDPRDKGVIIEYIKLPVSQNNLFLKLSVFIELFAISSSSNDSSLFKIFLTPLIVMPWFFKRNLIFFKRLMEF